MITSAEEFVALLMSDDIRMNQRAINDSAPDSVWMEVIQVHPHTRGFVARNKTIPASVIDILSRDADAQVRGVIAMKRKTSPEILERLAADESDGVRRSVVYNRKTPHTVLQTLTNDTLSDIANQAVQRLTEKKPER